MFEVPIPSAGEKATLLQALLASLDQTSRSRRPHACGDVFCRNLGDLIRARKAYRAGS